MALSPERIRKALLELGLDDDGDWTTEGMPSMESLKAITKDQTLSRAQVTAAAPTFTRSNPNFESPKQQAQSVAPVTPEPALPPMGSELARMEAELAAMGEEVNRLDVARHEATRLFDAARQKRDRFSERVARMRPANLSQQSIQSYLRAQEVESQKRAEEIEAIRASGIDLEKLRMALPSGSAIDSAMASRRGGRGRPAFPNFNRPQTTPAK
jgi:hypothetical protein